eukprot:65338_1
MINIYIIIACIVTINVSGYNNDEYYFSKTEETERRQLAIPGTCEQCESIDGNCNHCGPDDSVCTFEIGGRRCNLEFGTSGYCTHDSGDIPEVHEPCYCNNYNYSSINQCNKLKYNQVVCTAEMLFSGLIDDGDLPYKWAPCKEGCYPCDDNGQAMGDFICHLDCDRNCVYVSENDEIKPCIADLLPANIFCGNDDEKYKQKQKELDPESEERLIAFNKNTPSGRGWKNELQIPVNIHILYTGNQHNINYEQIISNIIVLNKDYNKENDDLNKIPAEFENNATNYQIVYKLSKIIRKYTSVSTFSQLQNQIKNGANGGSNAINPDDTLNIWVGNHLMGSRGPILGYAQFPWVYNAKTDGIAVVTDTFGSKNYDYAKTFQLDADGHDVGRLATHEIGHWIALIHIWGDGGCGADDEVKDTPIAAGPYRGCPTRPQNSCGTNDMFMNYMDYTDGDCQYMFTKGQRARTHGAFQTFINRKSFVRYQVNPRNPICNFTNAFYFVVNKKCGYDDTALNDLHDGKNKIFSIIPCIQRTKNYYVDPIIDIEVRGDKSCTLPKAYYINTDLNHGIDGSVTYVCYQKGTRYTPEPEKITNIKFISSKIARIKEEYEDDDGSIWTLVLFDINRNIQTNPKQYRYLGYQKNCVTTNPTANPTTNPTNDPTSYPTTDPTADPTTDPTTDPT